MLLKTTTVTKRYFGFGVEALGEEEAVLTCPMSHPVSDVWLLGLTGTAGDRTIQSGQDWRQSNVGYRLQTYCDVIL